MDNITAAIRGLKDSISAQKRGRKDVEEALIQLNSTPYLLKMSTIPPNNTFKGLSELFRQRLLPLYQVSLTRALEYSTAVLEFIHDEKLIPALNAKEELSKQLWQQLLTSLVSGVLDYLDQSPDAQSRDSIASVLYPVLSRIYFFLPSAFPPEFSGDLLSAVYQLLVTTVEPQARNAARLHDHGISSKRLGLTLSQIRDFLAIESLLDIICTLIPPIKNGLKHRSQFIKEVFDPDLFQCGKSILQILESITEGDWSVTAVRIIDALAKSDISFPQPFDASSLMICGIAVNTIAPLYVDKNGFLANLDQDGKVETLRVPFHTITRAIGSSINDAEISILLVLAVPPIIGTEPLSVPSGRKLFVSWHLNKSQLDKFAIAAKDRNLIFLNSTTRKLSLPGTHIAFNVYADDQPPPASTQEKIHDMAKLLATPSSPGLLDCIKSSSPISQQSDSASHKPAQLVTSLIEDGTEHRPLSVFLDFSGNLSFTDPVQPVNQDNRQLASTPQLSRPVAQRATNQEDIAAVTCDVIMPQIVQEPSIGKHKKKSVPTKNLSTIERHANLQKSQTTTLDAQLHMVSLERDRLAVDVGEVPDWKETIPLQKTQKHRSTAVTMIREVTKPSNESLKLKNSSLEINIPPVDLKRRSKKRLPRNMEDSEAFHISDEEHPTKRVRIDPGQPSHPAPTYQRKKCGRNGRASSPRAESPAVAAVDFDEIPEPKSTRAIERPKSRLPAMKGKRVGKETEVKAAVPRKGKQDDQYVKVDAKPTTLMVPESSAKTKRDNQASKPLSDIDCHATTDPETKAVRRSMRLTKAPSITQTQGHDEDNTEKMTQMALSEDKNFLQKVEGILEPVRLRSSSILKKTPSQDEISDHDHSLTLLVDDDYYKQGKKVLEPSTPVPDINMIDLTQDSPIPAGVPTKPFFKSSLKEGKPVANVQPALPSKQVEKVKVEISSPHRLPTKDRNDDRPSVSFALPAQARQYPWAETSTPARKPRIELDPKSHKIRRNWEKSDHNKATYRGVHQQRYPKVEEKRYEQAEEPMERIAEIIKQIGETVVHQISRRFDSVRDELHAGHRNLLHGTLENLEKMHEESTAHVGNMVQLEEDYALRCGNILKGFDDVRESAKNVSACFENIVEDHSQQSLVRKLPAKLFEKRTGILLNATIR